MTVFTKIKYPKNYNDTFSILLIYIVNPWHQSQSNLIHSKFQSHTLRSDQCLIDIISDLKVPPPLFIKFADAPENGLLACLVLKVSTHSGPLTLGAPRLVSQLHIG